MRASDGTKRWHRSAGTREPPALWGVTGGLLVAPDVLPDVVGVPTGEPWPVRDAWPSATARWYAAAGRRLVTLHTTGSSNAPELRLRTLPDGTSPRTREDVPA
ncbi:hypothetical protein [Streptomyces sp. NPDC017940]|uniref:hypothetical protein n=1 Tax=Streptomyces sp. NPDC017940 TaxID=3365017 RepID=UPI00379D886F